MPLSPDFIRTPAADTGITPAMRQYQAAKEAHPDALLFFRMGDFYELFYEDALVASRELQLTLTARDKARQVPMCGVPFHAGAAYLQKLLRKGYKVALCEQMEDPKLTKTVVRREVTRVLTPGTALNETLAAGESQWLAALAPLGTPNAPTIGVASLDLSTGEMRSTEFTGPDAWPLAFDELARMRPAETLLPRGNTLGAQSAIKPQIPFSDDNQPGAPSSTTASPSSKVGPQPDATPSDALPHLEGAQTELDDWVFTEDYAVPLLRQSLRVHSLDGMGLALHPAAATAAGALVHYLRHTKQGALEHLDTVHFYERRSCLELDAVSVRNLELVDPLFSGESTETTLLHTLDACSTPMGKRLLRAQLLRPLIHLPAINARLDAVALAATDIRRREAVRRAMSGILDLERLLGRIALDSAGPRELAALAATLACLPGLQTAVADLAPAKPPNEPSRWTALAALDTLPDLHELITRTLVDNPPLAIADGNVIRPAVDPELDDLRALSTTGRQRIAAIEERERERTGIASLKVRFNSVFGYYLEVTRANLKAVPPDYERKQTLVNAERFTTPELKDLETKILTAQERSGEIERRIFTELRRQLLTEAPRLRATSRQLAEIDLLANFAHLAALRAWTRPHVDESFTLEFLAGRHPVVERRLEDSGTGRFVPNSLSLCAAVRPTESSDSLEDSSKENHPRDAVILSEAKDLRISPASAEGTSPPQPPSLLLITGPNMGGKSTFLRQAALLTILAQCGSFVPAHRMRLGLVDRIYTRIGASDNVARGRSTFMVEMTETAAILNTATPRSLVLLDEMGRGTATYDGLSLAWATVEHLHNHLGARTLFATHYHELTLLADRPALPGEPLPRGGLPRMHNARATVRERDGSIVFLHTIEPGPANKSYGIEVARLAGLPAAVIHRAREVLRIHERAEAQSVSQTAPQTASPTVAHTFGTSTSTAQVHPPALQMTMFTPLSQRIVDRLATLDTDNLTPREALTLLADLQQELRESNA